MAVFVRSSSVGFEDVATCSELVKDCCLRCIVLVELVGSVEDDTMRIVDVSTGVDRAVVSSPGDGFNCVIARSKDFVAESNLFVSSVVWLISSNDVDTDELWMVAERVTSDVTSSVELRDETSTALWSLDGELSVDANTDVMALLVVCDSVFICLDENDKASFEALFELFDSLVTNLLSVA